MLGLTLVERKTIGKEAKDYLICSPGTWNQLLKGQTLLGGNWFYSRKARG